MAGASSEAFAAERRTSANASIEADLDDGGAEVDRIGFETRGGVWSMAVCLTARSVADAI